MYVPSFRKACTSGIFMFLILYLQKVRHIKQLPVDMNAIKEGLSSLMAPSQQPMFSPHMYAVINVFILLLSFPTAI